MRVSAPTPPVSLKRKAAVMEEEDELERARRAKIMQYMNPRIKPVVPRYFPYHVDCCYLSSFTGVQVTAYWM